MSTADSLKADGAAPTDFAPSWFTPPAGDAIAAPADADDPRPALRLWRLLLGARLLVATALLALEGAAWWWGNGPGGIVALCVAYLGLTAAGLALPQPPARSALAAPRWLVTVWADLAFFAVLELFAPGGINFTPLFVWPVLLAAVLGPRLLALGCASAGTLVLLAEAWRDSHAASTADWLQAGVTGTGLLIVALLASHLTARLAGEQRSAQRNRRLAAIQGEVNRLIVTGLGEGVVVLDAQGAVWYANHAAARMLGAEPVGQDGGTDPATALRHAPAWPVLTAWARATLAESRTQAPTAGRTQDVTLPLPAGQQRRVRLRARLAGLPAEPASAAVLFLEDLHDIEVRVRNEKLAAMGRVTAAVAHEIRNPLAAIAQASALLQEDDASPAQRQLVALIEQNVRRLDRTVDDVLETVRTPWHDTQIPAPELTLDRAVQDTLADWQRQRPQGQRLTIATGAGGTAIAFDPEHLRRVLVNLLDNADRHASHGPGAIRLETTADDRHAHLTVWSDSPDIPATVRQHLFEPFMSSYSRSSGLGLYLSRELCQRYHADLSHERAARDGRDGNAFVVRLPAVDSGQWPGK